MEEVVLWWCALALSGVPLLVWLVWSFNEVRFLAPLKAADGSNGSSKLPPGHMGFPFIGEMLSFLWYFKIVCRPDHFINSKREKYGHGVGMYRTHLFGYPTIITCSPATNKFILNSSDLFGVGWPSPELMGYTSISIVQGEQHTRVRSYLMNAINRPQALKQIALTVQPRLVASLHSWAEKGTILAAKEVKKVTFENVCMMFASLEAGPLLDALDNYFRGLLGGMRAQPLNIPGTAYHRALQCRKKLTAIFGTELEKRKQCGKEHWQKNDLMEGLMQIKDEEGKHLGDQEVLDNIVSLVIAGYESTALATTWALYHLAKSPHVLQRLREENMVIYEQKKGAFITMEDIAQMKYTSKVVEETIRMANIAPLILRTANKDVEYQGYRIPKDWKIAVWIRSIHTDPDNFEDPLNFNPDRWDEPSKPGTYQVFGLGARTCPGNMLARMQLSIFLHHMATGYKWELINPDAKIVYLPLPRPMDGLEITFSAI